MPENIFKRSKLLAVLPQKLYALSHRCFFQLSNQ